MRYMHMLMMIGITCGIAMPAMADVWYVDRDNHSGIEDGTSWQTAFTTVQPAIDAAVYDYQGEVWVAEGVYNEPRRGTSVRYDQVETGTLMVHEGIPLFGGFSGTEAARDERSPSQYKSVIDGSSALDGIAAQCVVFVSVNALIDGFTITGGDAREWGWGSGAALITEKEASPSAYVNNVSNCVFTNNHAAEGDAAVYLHSLVEIRNCVFRDNDAVGATGTNVQFYDCIFENNKGGYYGLRSYGASSLFARCIFRKNHAVRGGALNLYWESLVTNCLFEDNVADERGGALSLVCGQNAQTEIWAGAHSIYQCTFVNSQAPEGSTMYVYGVVDAQNDLMPDAGEQPVKLTGGTYEPSRFEQSGVLYTNPHFADPEHGDYRLMPDSPAIDANGLDTAVPERSTPDLAGTPRPIGANYDLGAYEYDPEADSDGDGITNDTEWTTYHTHPYKADTDGDYVPDGLEIQYGTDPLDPTSTPPILPLAAGVVLGGILIAAYWRARRAKP